MDEATGAVFGADGMCAGAAGVGKFADFTKGRAETVPLLARQPKVAFAPAPVAEAEEEEDELMAGMGGLAVVEEAPARKAPDAVIAYPGGKGKAFPILSMLIPDRYKVLTSYFVGGAGLELAWMRAGADREVWAFDADIDLINMYNCVKYKKEELRAALAKLADGDFEACKALLTTTPVHGDEIKRAAAKIFAHKMSFVGRISAGRDRGRAIARLADKADIDLSRMHFGHKDVFAALRDPVSLDSFYYLDPPYDGLEDYYAVGKGFDHRKLAAAVRYFTTKTPYWMMSYGDTPLIRELYGGWCDIMSVSWHYSSKQTEGTELLIRPRYTMPSDPNAGIIDPDALGRALARYPDDHPVHDLALTRDWATAFKAVKNSAFAADIALCIRLCIRQQLGMEAEL